MRCSGTNDCVSMYKHMLLPIFCIMKTRQNVKFILYPSPVIGGNMVGDPFLSCNAPPSPQSYPIQIWCHRSLTLYLQSHPVNTDTEGTIEIVHCRVSV